MTELELFDRLNPKRDLPQATCDVISQVYKVMQKDNAEKDKQIKEQIKEQIEVLKRLMDIINHDLRCFDTMAGLDIKQKAEKIIMENDKIK